jgi:hypothetical protein
MFLIRKIEQEEESGKRKGERERKGR